MNKFPVINLSFFASNRIGMQKLAAQTAVALCLVFGIGVTSAQADILILYAGQTIPVGNVEVTDDGTTMTVEYTITGAEWCITQTHLAIETSLALIPQTKKNNPIVGKFEFNDSHDCVSEVTYMKGITAATDYVVAAHAVVFNVTTGGTLTIVSDTNTSVTEVNGVPVAVQQSAVEAYEPVTYSTCSGYTLVDTANDAVWDATIGANSATFTAAGADWIWNTPNPEHPRDGDVVTFQETFSCNSASGGSILITADNAYLVELNGTAIGSAQIGPNFPSDLKEADVNGQGWQSVETHALIGFVNGDNTLTIVAANEFMDVGDAGDPFPGTGVGGTSEGDGQCRNPGALIFKATVEGCLPDHHTAWGNGTNFDGRQWGTFIEYTTGP